MKWIEIITLRSHAKVDPRLWDELLRQIAKSDSSGHPEEIRIYQNSIVETGLSIHNTGRGGIQNAPRGAVRSPFDKILMAREASSRNFTIKYIN
jgi:hypothetical protein